jgi:dGTPase
MAWDDLYDEQDRARLVVEPSKRVIAPVRTPFERDRARVVHSASLRRLASKTQVVGPQTDDFARNRLTHSLEVAQVARDIAHPLGCHPDIVETAALAHDLGHPPFGHNGETVLDELAQGCGGFEGNAQTLRILTRLEAKSRDELGNSVGLNLTRATLDACTKYPWTRRAPGTKFGVYDDDLPVFEWMRTLPGERRCIEAQIMDFGDDVAYSVHDLEDGIVGGHVDPQRIDTQAVWEVVRSWYLPGVDDASLDAALAQIRAMGSWPTRPYDGSRNGLAALKDMTSDLVGIFCGEVHLATREAHGDAPLVRYRGDLVIPDATLHKIAVLKGIAAHYVMLAPDRLTVMEQQRTIIEELFELLSNTGDRHLDAAFANDFADADDDSGRMRVWVDQIASLTDESCLRMHQLLVRQS